ncbi:MAG: hypothetical protein KBI47_18380 [Armatimonadetes bacterium]|nr:hypothetical protein [Armatimonadota bacterium]
MASGPQIWHEAGEWSPDGSRAVFAAPPSGSRDLQHVEIASSALTSTETSASNE